MSGHGADDGERAGDEHEIRDEHAAGDHGQQDHADHADHGHGHESYREQSGETRTTAPMQRYSVSQAGIGAAMLAVGVAVAYLLPVLAA